MKKLKLALYVGLPLFLTVRYLLEVHSGHPVSLGSGSFILDTLAGLFIAAGFYAASWLPVAYGIDKIYGHYVRKSQRKRNRDIFGSKGGTDCDCMFKMKKLKLALYIGMPIFGILLLSLGSFLASNLPAPLHPLHIPQILMSIDIVPIAIAFFIHEGLLLRNFDGDVHDTLEVLSFFMAHIVFWIPVAHYINKLWERHERKSKRNVRL